MHISAVPEEVLAMVLHRAAALETDNPHHWGQTLPLLGVCRYWRYLAQPTVYRRIYITGAEGVLGAASGVRLVSNIPLAAASQSVRHVRQVRLHLSVLAATAALVSSVTALLGAEGVVWDRAQTLTVCISALSPPRNAAQRDGGRLPAVGRAASRIHTALPGITQLDLSGRGDEFARKLGAQLACAYISQLTRLSSHATMALAAPRFSSQLSYLCMAIGSGEAAQLPAVYAPSLRCLCLHLLPRRYSWAPFLDAAGTGELVFENLYSLTVSYAPLPNASAELDRLAGVHAITAMPKLRFPKLGRMAMSGCPADCTILSRGIFPQSMRRIALLGAAHAAVLLANTALNAVDELTLTVVTADGGRCSSADFMRATNLLFGSTCARTTSTLSLCESVALVDPAEIAWHSLGKLTINDGTDASVLLAIMGKATSITELVAFHISIDMTPCTVSRLLTTRDTQLLLLGSGIERLRISYAEGTDIETDGLHFSAFIMAKLCRLKLATFEGVPGCLLLALVESLQGGFAHLAHVTIGDQ